MNHSIEAPEGFESLRAGEPYILIRNNPKHSTLLIGYDGKRNASLHYIGYDRFAQGLAAKQIISRSPSKLPTWLAPLENMPLDLMDTMIRDSGKRGFTHLEHVEMRLLFIAGAVAKSGEILSEKRPDRTLNKLAKECVPPQNERRFRNWFYTYIAFGANKWALLPAFQQSGRWDRNSAKHEKTKFGRPSSGGRYHGHPSSETMIKDIETGFAKYAKDGLRMTTVYGKVVTKVFGCVPQSEVGKRTAYVHPEGMPFPSYWQFRYRCRNKYSPEGVRRALIGDDAYRQQDAPPMGRYTEELTNLFERVNSDARYSKEYPRSYIPTAPFAHRLCIVEIYCGLSKFAAGIGFSLRGEKHQAYQAALFCMAISKSRFGEIMGIQIDDKEWPSKGLPASFFTDRGPGSSEKVNYSSEGAREMTPSFTPQSNSTAESKHPRARKPTGIPSYEVSDLLPIQMAKREILRLINQNQASSSRDNVDFEMIVEGVATPFEMFTYLNSRLRNDAQMIPFEEAVRRFLEKVDFNVIDGRLRFHSFEYSSDAFMKTELFTRLRKSTGVVQGYVLEISVRKAWIEADGRLVEVDISMPFRTPKEQTYVSLGELAKLGKLRATNEYLRKESLSASEELVAQTFQKLTGLPAEASSRRVGQARPNSRIGKHDASGQIWKT